MGNTEIMHLLQRNKKTPKTTFAKYVLALEEKGRES